MSAKVGVAAVGDVLDIHCWSNIPYYFFEAGKQQGIFHQPWSLQMSSFQWPRQIWSAKQFLLGRGIGGYQYSDAFLDRAERQIPPSYLSSQVISFNQVFPRAQTIKKAGGKIYYYIDATLHDLFQEQAYEIRVPKKMQEQAIRQEKLNYQAATAVVVMGNWVTASLLNDYEVPVDKIQQVLPGANITLPVNFEFSPLRAKAGISRPLVLGFVGKDWKRKGLPLLMQVRDLLASRGYEVIVKAVGNCPEELRKREGLEYVGYIDKQTAVTEFIDFLASCDVGCLFSKTEALGISTLEFLRVGVPVMGFYHQGLRDTLLPGASIQTDIQSSVEALADQLEYYITHPESQQAMKSKAQEYATFVTWNRCVGQISSLLVPV